MLNYTQCSNNKDHRIQHIQNTGTRYAYHRGAMATRKQRRQRLNAREFRARPSHAAD